MIPPWDEDDYNRLGYLLLGLLAAVLLGALATGCGVDDEGIPWNWEGAADHVWHVSYGQTERRPELRLVRGEALDCSQGRGFRLPAEVRGIGPCRDPLCDACLEGLFLGEAWAVWVADLGQRPSRSALAHELGHALGWLRGDQDPEHRGSIFAAGGDVERAARELGRAGLLARDGGP